MTTLQKITRLVLVVIALLILFFSWFIPWRIVTAYPNKISDTPLCRSDSTYATVISHTYPIAKDSFTVDSVNCSTLHWTIVQVKNKANNDTAQALFYDPANSSQQMKLVAGPTVSFAKDNLSNHGDIPTKIYEELSK